MTTEQRKPFPAGGRGWNDLKADMTNRTADDIDWRAGRTPLFVFHADDETYEIGKNAYLEFFGENALGGKRAFFSIGEMEREILDYGLSLFTAPDGAAGAFSTGGSESIFMAMKAARDSLRARRGFRPGEDRLNLVMPITAHPGFDKAADAMDIEIRRGEVGEDKRAGADSLRPLIDERTIAIVGSAPCFPHGVVDRIDELSALALEADVWLHVDACVGGWLAPWFTAIGRSTPTFDFRHEGVRSISADLHKFGFCPKPASTVFYRDRADLERATFMADAWPNGKFGTPTLAGTRPGGAVAASWAVLNHLGESGYKRIATQLSTMIDNYVSGLEELGFRMIARPDFSIINYTTDDADVFEIAEAMTTRGWLPGLTRNPKGLHAMMSLLHEKSREAFLEDLAWAAGKARAGEAKKATIEATY
ncbi:pyridoxal phosphate-dependent decarboxylase family protein [Pikeienuella sp. HZG-20]|uniref:pyridoxal phosphate-dependent decarboxylase family protein n=1 Tax=Paludibacillus litoralis TaxID=3133267 RepID=UPI0030EEF5D7